MWVLGICDNEPAWVESERFLPATNEISKQKIPSVTAQKVAILRKTAKHTLDPKTGRAMTRSIHSGNGPPRASAVYLAIRQGHSSYQLHRLKQLMPIAWA